MAAAVNIPLHSLMIPVWIVRNLLTLEQKLKLLRLFLVTFFFNKCSNSLLSIWILGTMSNIFHNDTGTFSVRHVK